MNDEKHLRELIQAVLDEKPLQNNITGSGWVDCPEHSCVSVKIENILKYHASNYRIKPKVKTFTYQTRVYMVNETIRVWSSADYLTEERLEAWDARQQFKWLAPAQTHTIEYTE